MVVAYYFYVSRLKDAKQRTSENLFISSVATEDCSAGDFHFM